MKKVIFKITPILMIFVLLFSTMSFTVNMHFCGGTLVETALFHKTEGCGMDMEKPTDNDCSVTKKKCCEDKQFVHDGQNELQKSVDKISFEQQFFIASFVYTYFNLFESSDTKASILKTYKPPLVIKKIFKLDENYLI